MERDINQASMLRVGTVLRGIYRIDHYLSSGGFGNTYIATNTEFNEVVAIKEFFIKGVSQRDNNMTTVSVSNGDNDALFSSQLAKFKKEARRIRKLKGEHIVQVHDMFEENGTAYYVMDFINGESMSERMERLGRPFSEEEVQKYLPQMLDALDTIHKEGIFHLDLKPGNVMVDVKGVVRLIDFGASKQQSNDDSMVESNSTLICYTNGFAPVEQMERKLEKIGPWTDIYALGATLYSMLTMKKPPMPSDIDDDRTSDKSMSLPFPDGVSEKMRQLILKMMATRRFSRPQSVQEVYELMKNGGKEPASSESEETVLTQKRPVKVTPPAKHVGQQRPPVQQKPVDRPTYVEAPPQQKSSSKKFLFMGCGVAALIGVIAIVLGAVFMMGSDNTGEPLTYDSAEAVEKKAAVIIIWYKSADKVDFHALARGNGKYEVIKSEYNYTPSDRQENITVSSNEDTNRLNKVDALLEVITSAYSSAKLVFIAQRNLKNDPGIKEIDRKLTGINMGIHFYNPSDYSSDNVMLVEEFVNHNIPY